MHGRRLPRLLLAALLALAAALALPALAAAAQQVISAPAGPLTNIYVNDDLGCQFTHAGDSAPEFFGGTDPGACGTLASVDGTMYGPANLPAGPAPTPWTSSGPQATAGTGTAADPFTVTTDVDAGATGLHVHELDSYVVGQEVYRTSVTVTNANASGPAIAGVLYHGADCFLQDSDSGFGFFDATTGGIYCSVNPSNSPSGRIEGFVPLTAGSHHFEGGYGSNWSAITSGADLPDTCDCTTDEDNGASISWRYSVDPGESATYVLATSSSPTGVVPDTTPPAVTLDQPADGSTVATHSPGLSGAAGTASGDLADVTVDIYAGSTPSGSPVQTVHATASGAAWSTAATNLTDGEYTAVASQSDDAGNVGTSAAHTFTVSSGGDDTPPAVTLLEPADGATLDDPTPALSGTGGTSPGDDDTVTVRVYAGSTPSGTPVQTLDAAITGGIWSTTAQDLGDGTYTVQAEQDDQAGNAGISAAHTFQVVTADTTAPHVTIDQPAAGASLTDTTPRLAGAAGTAPGDEDTVAVRLYRGTATSGSSTWSGTTTAAKGRWAVDTSALSFGRYTARAEQRDAAGHTGVSAPVTFTVDPPAGADLQVTVTPSLPLLVGRAARYTVEIHNHGPADATGVRLAANLPAGADLPAHEEFAPATPGCSRASRLMTCFAGFLRSGETLTYRFLLTPRHAGSMDLTAVATAAQADPASSTNTRSADAAAVRPPTIAKTVVAARVSGVVRVKRRGSKRFKRLTTESLVPVGSLVDATRGRVRLTSERTAGGRLQTADFYRGRFLLGQERAQHGLTTLDLRGSSFKGCPKGAQPHDAASVARRRHHRRLWGSGHGSFRTRGRFGSATVRGTIWYTQDACRATYFKTRRGVVTVRNYVKNKTVRVPAGHSYYARAPRP